MNIKEHVYKYVRKKSLIEGFDEQGNPDTKYYAFDWDDNIMFMPTQIIVMTENEEEVGMSTEEFAEHRHQIGSEPFNFKGTTVVGYAPDPFRNFGVKGDKRFVIDSMIAPLGPSWNDFVECINGGSIFAIITARGHNPETLKEAVLNLIVANHNGINRQTLVDNLIKYRQFTQDEQIEEAYDLEFSDKDIINEYLDMCRFHPVSFGAGSAANPEEGKINALREFISYCKELANKVGGKVLFKNDVSNNFVVPSIGFSDDDERNVEKVKEFLNKEFGLEHPVTTYLTKAQTKTRY